MGIKSCLIIAARPFLMGNIIFREEGVLPHNNV